MRERYKILLLIALTLVIFLPSVQSGYFAVDDLRLVNGLKKSVQEPLAHLLQPTGDTYYRPLVGLSYIADARLWDLKPSFMHLMNILIHALNAILVFFITRRLTSGQRATSPYLPFLASFLFIIHPVNTESINWISGRSDPLATLFCLLAAYLFILALHHLSHWPLWFAATSILVGSLAKETALFMYPGFILTLLFFRPARNGLLREEKGTRWRLVSCIPFIAGGLLYSYLRSSAYSKVDLGIKMTIDSAVVEHSVWSKLETMIAAFGFYIKKLVVPFPLDFAIGEIDPRYFWVGLLAAPLLMLLISRRDRKSALVLFMLLPIIPALLVPVVKYAFMPAYAERYLYLSTAFFSIALAVYSVERRGLEKAAALPLLILIIAYLPGSVQRNFLWADHVQLLENAEVQVLEYPHFWNAYCVALADEEQYDKARNEYYALLSRHPEDQLAYINLAKMELYINDPDAARYAMNPFFQGELDQDKASLEVMVDVNQARLAANPAPGQRVIIQDELIKSRLKLYDLVEEPGLLVAAAETALDMGAFDLTEELVDRLIAMNGNDITVTDSTRRILSELKSMKN